MQHHKKQCGSECFTIANSQRQLALAQSRHHFSNSLPHGPASITDAAAGASAPWDLSSFAVEHSINLSFKCFGSFVFGAVESQLPFFCSDPVTRLQKVIRVWSRERRDTLRRVLVQQLTWAIGPNRCQSCCPSDRRTH